MSTRARWRRVVPWLALLTRCNGASRKAQEARLAIDLENAGFGCRSRRPIEYPGLHLSRDGGPCGINRLRVGRAARVALFVLGLRAGWSITPAPDAVAREFSQEALMVR
jgi:hypothetical protein